MSKLLAFLIVAFVGFHGLVEGAPLNLFGTGIVPKMPFAEEQGSQAENEMVKMANMLTAVSEKTDKAEIQSKDEIAKLFLDTFSTLLSAAEKKVNPKDDLTKTALNGFQSILSLVGKNIGDVQTESLTNENLSDEAEVQFDWGQFVVPLVGQLISKAVDGSSNSEAEIEAFTRLPEEAKEQFWGQILSGLATHLISNAISGGSTVDTAAAVEALPEEAKEQLWGKLLGSLATHLFSKAVSGGSTFHYAYIEALPEEAKEQFWGKLLGKLATQFVVNKLAG